MNAYILGLWLGDKYWWSSSLGISNSNLNLIKIFKEFLTNRGFEKDRIKLSVYTEDGKRDEKTLENLAKELEVLSDNIKFYKLSKKAGMNFVLYVNSRPLLREFRLLENNIRNIVNENNFVEYFAGRYDADGHHWKEKRMIRIAYTSKLEANNDAMLAEKFTAIKPKIRFYSKANEWILEFCGYKWLSFINSVLEFSCRLSLANGHRQLVP